MPAHAQHQALLPCFVPVKGEHGGGAVAVIGEADELHRGLVPVVVVGPELPLHLIGRPGQLIRKDGLRV